MFDNLPKNCLSNGEKRVIITFYPFEDQTPPPHTHTHTPPPPPPPPPPPNGYFNKQ